MTGKRGTVLEYFPEYKIYQIVSDATFYYIKPNDIYLLEVNNDPRLPNNTVVEFSFAERIRKGIVVDYYPAIDKYRVACELGKHYAKREDLIVCPEETVNQDNLLMTQNHHQHPSPGEKMPAENTTNNEEQLKLLAAALDGSRGQQQQIIDRKSVV